MEDWAVGYESEGKIEVNGVPGISGSALFAFDNEGRRGWEIQVTNGLE